MEEKITSKKEEKEETKVEEKDLEKKSKKKRKWIWFILLLLIIFLIWFFLKFTITFKYNNGLDDYQTKVRFLMKIDEKDVKNDLTLEGKTFVGYFETYYLSGEEIAKIKENSSLKETICKEEFRLEEEKCIAKEKFDFENTRIMKNKTIEAFWSNIDFNIDPKEKTIYVGDNFTITATISGTDNKEVTWTSNNQDIATVDNNGNVSGVKVGKATIIAESNGIKRECTVTVSEKPIEAPKDNGKISLNASGQCMIGTSSVTAKATITNALDNIITWTYPKCFAHEIHESDNSVKLYRTMVCPDTEETNPVLSAKLNNGSTDSLTFTYEPKLTYTVYDGSHAINGTNGEYQGGSVKITTNIDATFSGRNIKSNTSRSVELYSTVDSVITIKTNCGQTETVTITAVIN